MSGMEYELQTNSDVDQVLEKIASFDVMNKTELLLEVEVTLQDLDQFAILGRVSRGGNKHTLYDDAVDFTDPAVNGLILMAYKFTTATGVEAADNNLTTTAALESALLLLNVTAYEYIEVQAACVANNGNARTHASAQFGSSQ